MDNLFLNNHISKFIKQSIELHNYKDAQINAERYLAEHECEDGYYLLSLCYFSQNYFQQALEVISKYETKHPLSKLLKARIYFQMGDFKTALSVIFENGSKQNKLIRDFGEYTSFVYQFLGEIYMEANYSESAEFYFKKCIELNPLHWQSISYLINTLNETELSSLITTKSNSNALKESNHQEPSKIQKIEIVCSKDSLDYSEDDTDQNDISKLENILPNENANIKGSISMNWSIDDKSNFKPEFAPKDFSTPLYAVKSDNKQTVSFNDRNSTRRPDISLKSVSFASDNPSEMLYNTNTEDNAGSLLQHQHNATNSLDRTIYSLSTSISSANSHQTSLTSHPKDRLHNLYPNLSNRVVYEQHTALMYQLTLCYHQLHWGYSTNVIQQLLYLSDSHLKSGLISSWLANAYMDSGDINGAYHACKDTALIDPYQMDLATVYSMVLVRLGKISELQAYSKRIHELKQKPRAEQAYLNAQIYFAQEDSKNSIFWYKQAISLDMKYIPAHLALFHEELALDNLDEARIHLNYIFKYQPHHIKAWICQALLLHVSMGVHQAFDLYNRLIIRYPLSLAVLQNFADHLVQYQTDKRVEISLDRALEMLNRATHNYPKDIGSTRLKGDLLLKLCRYKEALQVYRTTEAMLLKPDRRLCDSIHFVCLKLNDRSLADVYRGKIERLKSLHRDLDNDQTLPYVRTQQRIIWPGGLDLSGTRPGVEHSPRERNINVTRSYSNPSSNEDNDNDDHDTSEMISFDDFANSLNQHHQESSSG